MKRVKDKIGNDKKYMFDGEEVDRVYYSGDTKDAENNVLPYGEDI